ncbi:MAG: hypothetical protein WCI43_08965 [Candidatus Firestonebacteria bacterium]
MKPKFRLTVMTAFLAVAAAGCFIVPAAAAGTLKIIDNELVPGNTAVSYMGITVNSVSDKDGPRVVVKRWGFKLLDIPVEAHPERLEGMLKFGFVKLLGPFFGKQLVIMSYSGGAHCCTDYRVYTLGFGLKEIFRTYRWNTGYELSYGDINGDGRTELVQPSLCFDYFRAPHSESVIQDVIFNYSLKAGEFVPSKTPLDYIKTTARDYASPMSKALVKLLPFLYNGDEKKARETFEAVYDEKDKDTARKELAGRISGDPVCVYLNQGVLPQKVEEK